MNAEMLAEFKQKQKESWNLFGPLEVITTLAAPALVKFSRLHAKNTVLDVGCGSGVVAITAARQGAKVSAIDLSPVLIERANKNRAIANVDIELREGDVEALPYADHSFDVVLSQFGHMFAPRPQVATSEMLRVLKPGGTIAFSTWPTELFVGRVFNLVRKFVLLPEGVSSPSLWGDTHFVREQLSTAVNEITFSQGMMPFPAMSIEHYRYNMENTLGPIIKLVQDAKDNPVKLEQFRKELDALVAEYHENNHVPQHFLMTRAIKK